MGVMIVRRLTSATSLIAAAFMGPSAGAQEKGGERRVLDSFVACRAMADVTSRLTCYDRATEALEASIRSNDVRIVDRDDIHKARRSLFGLSVPALAVLGDSAGESSRDAFTEITTTIDAVRSGRDGRVSVTLTGDDAAVWQATDPVPFPPSAGAKIRIRKGAMGGFFMNVDGRSYRAIRVR